MNDLGMGLRAHVREYASLTNVLQARGAITGVSSIADRMKEARERLAISQAELAKRSGVKPGTIGNIEAGSRRNPRELLAIADALGVDPKWLQNGSTKPAGAASRPLPAGGGVLRLAHPLSHSSDDDSSKVSADVPVIFTGRPTASGGIELEQLQSAGTVAAAFVGPAAYAIKIDGEGLHPFVRHGTFVVVNPGGPLVAGELVLIRLRDGTSSLRELLLLRDDAITTAHVDGTRRETTPRTAIETIEPVSMQVSSSHWKRAAA